MVIQVRWHRAKEGRRDGRGSSVLELPRLRPRGLDLKIGGQRQTAAVVGADSIDLAA